MDSSTSEDRKNMGAKLILGGVFFSILGLFFISDSRLLSLGHILLYAGGLLTAGPDSTEQILKNLQNLEGIIPLGAGIGFFLNGWPIVGMILEAVGVSVLVSVQPLQAATRQGNPGVRSVSAY
ncbi:Vesicle transport protein GOT1 [Linum perenne]